jgi:hypothetical protein
VLPPRRDEGDLRRGESLKKWARSTATELLTAAGQQRSDAARAREPLPRPLRDPPGVSVELVTGDGTAPVFGDAGQSTVRVADGAKAVSATTATCGETGALTASGTATTT